MFLAGSNNCYDIGNGGRNGRRARDWQSFLYYNRKGKLSEKPGIILKNLDADLRKVIRRNNGKDSYEKAKPSDIRKRWGYYSAIVVGSGSCGGTSWDRWRRQFANGIKHALTIEELDKLGVNPYFSSYGDSPDGKPAEIGLNTESQYFTELKKWREWQAKSQRSFSLSFSPNNTDTVLSRLHANKHRTPREKQRVEQAHYFTLTDGSSALIKYTSRGYKYSWNKTGGKKFMTEKEAEDYRKQLVAKERYKAEIWKVERINSPCNFYV
jgi:hypothetical protein